MKCLRYITGFASLFALAHAAELPKTAELWQPFLRWENDIALTNSDRWYTNGVQMGLVFPEARTFSGQDEHTGATAWLIQNGPFSEAPDAQARYALSITSMTFTPENYEISVPDPNDRPYAGWLRLDGALHVATAERLDVLELSLGITGDPSLSQDGQRFIHEIIYSPEPLGWASQIPFSPNAQLTWLRHWRHRRGDPSAFAWDIVPYAGATFGNVQTYAQAGLDFRYGFRLPDDFGQTRIMLGGRQGTPLSDADVRLQEVELWSAYLVAGFDARAICYDATIEGTLFRNSVGVDVERLVADFRVGMGFSYGSTSLSFTEVFRSKEFEGQDAWHSFGSLTLTTLF